jgi:hypothetical protein
VNGKTCGMRIQPEATGRLLHLSGLCDESEKGSPKTSAV